MKKILKRTLAVFLAAVMAFGAAPLAGFVGLELPNIADFFNIKAEATSYSGTCGADLTWTLDTVTGILEIGGTGDMTDWNSYLSSIPWYSYRSHIKTVTIGDGVTSIGDYAFYDCNCLTSVTIGNGVTSIGDCAFCNCTNLTSITIPDSVTSIGYSAFSSTALYNDSSNWENDVLYIDNHLIEAKHTISETYTIKSGTKTIASNAFSFCTSLVNITIPDSAIIIDSYAFYDCDGLTNVTIPDNVTSIGDYAFYDCNCLTSVTIGNGVTSIGWDSFCNCINLTNITIPDSITSIYSWTFYNTAYYNDDSNWENGLLYIGNHLIAADEKISYKIKRGTKTIASNAFINCESFTSITIPDDMTSIGDSAFYGCTDLTDVYFTGSKEEWYAIVIDSGNECLTNATIYFNYVSEGGEVTGIDIHDSKIQLKDKTMLMEATVYPETAENKDIIWKSSNTEVADFYDNSAGILMGYKDGYTVITATTVEGGYTDSCIVFVGDSTITVSSLDGNYIPQNKTHEFNVTLVDINCLKLTEMGNVCICGTTETASSNISFVIENNSVATIENITSFSDNIIKLKLKGIATGTTYLTIKNIKTGETKYIPIYVYDGENTFLADNVPQTNEGYEHRGILNFSHENIHVYDYEFTENSNCSVDVSFTAYNQNTNNGSVEIYDSEGNLKNSFMLEAHNGGNPTGVWENVKQMGEIIKTWGNLDIYDPTSGVWSTKTKISATIPKDGYIKITNDITNSNICLMYNVFDIVVKSIDLGEKGIDLGEKAGKVTEKITKTVVEKISEIPEDTIKKFVSKFVEELTKSNSINDTGVLLSLVQDFVDIIKLDFEKIVLESIESVVAEKLTDIALDRLPVYGKVVKGLYAVNEFIQFYDLGEACYSSIGSGSAYIYVKQDENKKVSNGIVYEGYADTETVLRTYAITYGGIHDNLALDYGVEDIELYDISLVKDGD